MGFINGVAEEIVVDGHNGYLGTDLHDMARKSLAASGADRMRCRNFVENNFSVQSMYEKYMDVYRQVY